MPITVLQPSDADAWLLDSAPNTNFGASTDLDTGEQTGGANIRRGLLRFDFSSIPPGSRVVSALLELTVGSEESNTTRTFYAYRLLRNWVEAEATWNVWATAQAWQIAGGGGALDREFVAVGLIGPVPANPVAGTVYSSYLDPGSVETMISGSFPNYGWLLKSDVEVDDLIHWVSSEHGTAAWRPKFTVTWTPALGRLPTYIVDGLQGGISLKSSIDDTANRIWARFTPTGGSLTRSAIAEDTAAQAKYGIKEQPLQGGNASAGVAAQLASTYLGFVSSPLIADLQLAPGVIVRDQLGNPVPLEEIRPNNWLYLENVFPPSAKIYSSLIQDPAAHFIEEVTYDERYGLRIVTAKERFVSALVAKISGRGSA